MSSAQAGEIYIKVTSKGYKRSFGEWDDGPGGQVRQILLWHRDMIYGIQTTYERDGTTVVSQRHGGTEGDFEAISLDEPLTWISGHYEDEMFEDTSAGEMGMPFTTCTVILSLKFGTRRATYGPFGREKGTPFSFKMPTGCGGFHGRSRDDEGGFLLAIGVYVRAMAKHCINETPSPSMVKLSPEEPMMLESTHKSKGQSLTEGDQEGNEI